MSYENPTPQEIRIAKNLQRIGKRIERELERASGGRCDWLLVVTPRREPGVEHERLVEAPVANYIASTDRESSAMILLELLAKWQANRDLPPLHELRDADGRTLEEILGAGPN